MPLLLVAYDSEYPYPLRAKRAVPDAFGAAFVLTPERESASLARIEAVLTDEAIDTMTDPPLEALRTSIPAARGLPLLRELAFRRTGRTVLEYLDGLSTLVLVEPCV